MRKEKCLLCGKPIHRLDFYVEYPKGCVCGACLSKKQPQADQGAAPAPIRVPASSSPSQSPEVEDQIIRASLP